MECIQCIVCAELREEWINKTQWLVLSLANNWLLWKTSRHLITQWRQYEAIISQVQILTNAGRVTAGPVCMPVDVCNEYLTLFAKKVPAKVATSH